MTERRLQLFCLPHAGGSAAAYRTWPGLMPPGVSVHPLELPGRGSCHREKPIAELKPLVAKLALMVEARATTDYALFGHSMGSLLAFELARALRGSIGEPAALLVSGRNGPSVPSCAQPIHHLPGTAFTSALQRFGGVPPEVLDHPELLEMFLPRVRGDLRLTETYTRSEAAVLNCPVAVFAGLADDSVDQAGLLRWRLETTGGFSLTHCSGDHFFLGGSDFRSALRARLQAVLNASVPATPIR